MLSNLLLYLVKSLVISCFPGNIYFTALEFCRLCNLVDMRSCHQMCFFLIISRFRNDWDQYHRSMNAEICQGSP